MILVGGIFGPKILSGKTIQEGQYDDFAKYLTEKGVKMYGTEWCSHCKNQKELFGSSFQYINYIDCDKNKKECTLENITGYPTWKINNTKYSGEQSLERLAELTEYPDIDKLKEEN